MVPETTYLSREDSQLLRRAILNESGSSFLEIGVGYGSNLTSARENFDVAVGTDIRRTEPFEKNRGSVSELVLADRATCFRASTFDLVVANPPYLPSEQIEDIAIDGGIGGFEIPLRFLQEMIRVMKREGKAFILLSSESDIKKFETFCNENSTCFRAIAQEKLFFETLTVYELKKRQEGVNRN